MVIIIFGLSGSGKSTMAEMIGKEYGLRVVHPSSILRDLIEGKKANVKDSKAGVGFWESKNGIKMFNSRLTEKKPMDVEGDKILVKELNKGAIVMDSWTMPWLFNRGIKIYLKGTLAERVKRVAKRSKISISTATKTVRMKDDGSRKMFKRVYGFDIKKDMNVFDFTMDTTKLGKQEVFNKIVGFLKH